jgi:hypothetical protein
MTHVEIVFTGIMTFLAATGGDPMAVVALNVPTEIVASSGAVIPPHVTWVRFDMRELADDSAVRPDREISINGLNYGVVFLHGERARILNASNADDLVIDDGVPRDSEMPTAGNQKFLRWVPHLRDVLGTDIRVKPAYVESDPNPELINFRMELLSGHLATSLVAPVLWEFRPVAGKGVRQAIAQEVTLSTVSDDPVVLELKRFRSATTRLLHLLPVDGKVGLFFANGPESSVEPGHGHAMPVDFHFELYYRMLADMPAVRPVPYRVDLSRDGGGWYRSRLLLAGGFDCGPDGLP